MAPPADGGPQPLRPRRGPGGLEHYARLARRELSVPVAVLVDDPADLGTTDLGVPVVSWLAMPVADGGGAVRAYLCAVDATARAWSEAELEALRDIASACAAELSLRDAERESRTARRTAEAAEGHARLLLALSEALAAATTEAEVVATTTAVAREQVRSGSCRIMLVDRDRRVLREAVAADVPTWLPPELRELSLDSAGVPPVDVATSGEPVFAADVREADLPEALQRVAEAAGQVRWAFVPLSAGPGATGPAGGEGATAADGVLALSWEAARAFSPLERETLTALGRYGGQALHRARLLADQREAASTLQEALLTALPRVPGVELAASYAPAAAGHRVGGDWYDAFAVGATTVLVVGDVMGHDIAAAAAMGSLRSMLRALADDRPDSPAGLVRRLDAAVAHLGGTPMTTLVCAVLEPPGGEDGDGGALLRWTSAGHLPLLVAAPDAGVRVLDEPPELLLGVRADAPRSDHALRLAPGSTVLLYTDGLVERRGEDLPTGIARLAASLGAHAALPLPALVEAVVTELCTPAPDDDVVVLAVRLEAR